MIATPRKPRRGDYVTIFLHPPVIQPISGRLDRIVDSNRERYYLIWRVWKRIYMLIPHHRVDKMFKLPKPIKPPTAGWHKAI